MKYMQSSLTFATAFLKTIGHFFLITDFQLRTGQIKLLFKSAVWVFLALFRS